MLAERRRIRVVATLFSGPWPLNQNLEKRIVSGPAQFLGPIIFWTRAPSQSMVKLSEAFKACCGYIFSGKNPRNIYEIRSQIFGQSHFVFPLRLLPERAFETLTAPHPYRYFMRMHAYRHNSSAGFCGRSFLGIGNNNRDDRAPPVSCELSHRLS